MNTTGKLGIAASIITSVTMYMAYVGTATSWQYFLTIEECLSQATDLVNQPIRVTGRVATDSLEIAAGREHASFTLREAELELPVRCIGPLPDTLAEEMNVVVEGRLNEAGHLQGEKVLTQCASKYNSEARLTTSVRPATSAEGRR
jgi:cytochrome c-type biogenesis protein CcmE